MSRTKEMSDMEALLGKNTCIASQQTVSNLQKSNLAAPNLYSTQYSEVLLCMRDCKQYK